MAKRVDRKYWVFKVVPSDERTYEGNEGYEDDLETLYAYDNKVQNCRQVQSGDQVVIVNKEKVLGFTEVSSIKSYPSTKKIGRCPFCGTTDYNPRKTLTPKYRCKNGHEFQTAEFGEVPITKFEASYGQTFHQPLKELWISDLKPYYVNGYNRNMSIQRLDQAYFDLNQPVSQFVVNYPEAEDAELAAEEPNSVYVPTDEDTRESSFRSIKQRRGQKRFRDGLRKRYGDKCMISGCSILAILEAAHIKPHRGDNDHHLENGIILRADLHTLFDLDLIGIHPQSLTVDVHYSIVDSNYRVFHGQRLQSCSDVKRPGSSSLTLRWRSYQKKLNRRH